MRFVLRRVGFFLLTLWAALTINFIIPRLMPGNPAIAMMARFKGRVNGSVLHALEVQFGVDTSQSLWSQYVDYMKDTLTGHLGVSTTFFPEPVTDVIKTLLPWTLGLIGMTTILAFIMGTVIGIVGGWRRGGKLDSVLPPIFVVTSAFPYFWVAMMAILIFAVILGWFPANSGYDSSVFAQPELSPAFVGDVLVHSILPAGTILVTAVGGWILTMRNNMITVVAEDYVAMARAKGLKPHRVMYDYGARNAILPNLTGFAMSLGFVVSGAILVEYVFNYPGLGFVLLEAAKNEDYALMQGLFLIITLGVLLAVLAADLMTAVFDPRTRDES
jgi:peptide/nickel transport system permease protein